MSNEFILNVNKRDLCNKGERKRSLKQGKIPGIYYSHDSKESISFYIESKELIKAQKSDSRIFNINVGSKKRNVLFKAIQYHPVTDQAMHIDLYGIKMDQVVSIKVGLILTGSAEGVKEGGVLVQVLNELDVSCLPMDIPNEIQVDVSDLEIGQNIKVSDLTVDDKIKIETNLDEIIASVTQAMKEEEVVVEVDEDAEFLEGDEIEGEGADKEEESSDKPKEESSEDSKETKGQKE